MCSGSSRGSTTARQYHAGPSPPTGSHCRLAKPGVRDGLTPSDGVRWWPFDWAMGSRRAKVYSGEGRKSMAQQVASLPAAVKCRGSGLTSASPFRDCFAFGGGTEIVRSRLDTSPSPPQAPESPPSMKRPPEGGARTCSGQWVASSGWQWAANWPALVSGWSAVVSEWWPVGSWWSAVAGGSISSEQRVVSSGQ